VTLRRSSAYLLFLAVVSALGIAAAAHARAERARRAPELAAKGVIVRSLGLTDLCLFTEARYTRHPSQADGFTPFQDSPGAPEHFPAGSIVPPPRSP
jgi:hypothetical protein